MKTLVKTLVLLICAAFVFIACDKKTNNQIVGTNPPEINDPAFEEIVNSAVTLNTDAYEIDQVKIAETFIYNDVDFTIIPSQNYSVYFRIKDKNSDNYIWKEGNWTISGSTIVVKSGEYIKSGQFYNDEPQNCQIDISFKGLTKNVNVIFKTNIDRPVDSPYPALAGTWVLISIGPGINPIENAIWTFSGNNVVVTRVGDYTPYTTTYSYDSETNTIYFADTYVNKIPGTIHPNVINANHISYSTPNWVSLKTHVCHTGESRYPCCL